MTLTPARIDLPQVGDYIAALHGSRQWYGGPLRVVAVDVDRRIVECRPLFWRSPNATMVFSPQDDEPPIRWNHLADLSDAEFDALNAHHGEKYWQPLRLQMRAIDGSRNAGDAIIPVPQPQPTQE